MVSDLDHVRAILKEMDRRYEQRFKASQIAIREALAAAEKAVLAALAAAEKAVEKAETAANNRFEAGNEIKAAMEAQSRTFATRRELEAALDQLRILTDRFNTASGQSRGSVDVWRSLPLIVGSLVGVTGLVIAYLS
jgi:ribosome maturation protein Sdo1